MIACGMPTMRRPALDLGGPSKISPVDRSMNAARIRTVPASRSRRHRCAVPLARRQRRAQPWGGPPAARRATPGRGPQISTAHTSCEPVAAYCRLLRRSIVQFAVAASMAGPAGRRTPMPRAPLTRRSLTRMGAYQEGRAQEVTSIRRGRAEHRQ